MIAQVHDFRSYPGFYQSSPDRAACSMDRRARETTIDRMGGTASSARRGMIGLVRPADRRERVQRLIEGAA